ncbi:hypothetical protein HanXRQr2_Chr06g0272491 [Helianthus annuus]|uniref:Uncharacterized protein n=1 Tax=Helianthus annuus TaxID=4232 RepID=A0A9K3IVH5_HELAN|nr:hypothetical protein HanXRQr2_Chr06g0272491 [Helianthus annuus]KAJ0561472.1 hypothetical protein HanHA300_Chr06g0223291 [Helianthus annuus]KAJ0568126.1 hypothetical protein HanIR_Chr06g0292611 [Helianthus annuus]KAJ0574530.1 hypothetical protein HanHA89_Chr06g0239181 [Helianthus annuus]KAJ0738862.1 hypothetical protein HanLR1_Chr06g0223091 [Helianthus annuus]
MMMMLAVSCGGGGSADDKSGALFRLGSGLGCLTPTPVRISGSPSQTQILSSKFRSGQASQTSQQLGSTVILIRFRFDVR